MSITVHVNTHGVFSDRLLPLIYLNKIPKHNNVVVCKKEHIFVYEYVFLVLGDRQI